MEQILFLIGLVAIICQNTMVSPFWIRTNLAVWFFWPGNPDFFVKEHEGHTKLRSLQTFKFPITIRTWLLFCGSIQNYLDERFWKSWFWLIVVNFWLICSKNYLKLRRSNHRRPIFRYQDCAIKGSFEMAQKAFIDGPDSHKDTFNIICEEVDKVISIWLNSNIVKL